MPMAGKGMLVTSMDIDESDEQEFNRWYDREHLAERVAIDGFLEARRYVAHAAEPKYFCLYSTTTFDVLDAAAYRRALANQTEWSRVNISRFRNMGRAVARISISRGQGRGASLGVVRIRPKLGIEEKLRENLGSRLDPGPHDGIISMHLLESDPNLSKSLIDSDTSNPGAGDWYLLIDGVDIGAVTDAASRLERDLGSADVRIISIGVYRLLWDLTKSDL
jgi:hypothetical protein